MATQNLLAFLGSQERDTWDFSTNASWFFPFSMGFPSQLAGGPGKVMSIYCTWDSHRTKSPIFGDFRLPCGPSPDIRLSTTPTPHTPLEWRIHFNTYIYIIILFIIYIFCYILYYIYTYLSKDKLPRSWPSFCPLFDGQINPNHIFGHKLCHVPEFIPPKHIPRSFHSGNHQTKWVIFNSCQSSSRFPEGINDIFIFQAKKH